jgi:hypothetical protein
MKAALRSPLRAVVTATASCILLSLGATASQAEDLATSVSCVRGHVDAYDYAELDQNFSESVTDTSSKLLLQGESAALTLEVYDLNGNSVCEEVATLKTSCTWNLTAGSTYSVKIDNTNRSTSSNYKLCSG